MSDNESSSYLIMPFVSVTSKGGPHDDDAYTCGWEMGRLDARLEYGEFPIVRQLIHTSNAAQADLIAMKHGYTSKIIAPKVIASHHEQWSWIVLTREAK